MIKYEVYVMDRSVVGGEDWIMIEVCGRWWTPSSQNYEPNRRSWVHGEESNFPLGRRIPLKNRKVEGYTALRIKKMMDEYGWMFIDPLSIQITGELMHVHIPKEKS